MRKILKIFILFLFGGVSYLLVEMAYRGYTHWTMLLVGGTCFVLLGVQNEIYTWEMAFVMLCIIG